MSKNVVIEVNGEHKLLKLGFNGFVELEKKLGKPITEISNGEVSFSDLRDIFQIALKRGGMKDATDENVGEILDEIIDGQGIDYLVEKLTELIESSMGNHPQSESFPDSKK